MTSEEEDYPCHYCGLKDCDSYCIRCRNVVCFKCAGDYDENGMCNWCADEERHKG